MIAQAARRIGGAAPLRAALPILRAAVGIGLLVLLAASIDLAGLRHAVASVNYRPLAVGVAIVILTVVGAALRWHLVLRLLGQHPPLAVTLPATFTGLFIGQFFPAGIGGDVYRVYAVCRAGVAVRHATTSVIADRAVAFVVLVAMTAAALPALAGMDQAASLYLVAAIGVVLVTTATLAVTVDLWFPRSWQPGSIGRVLAFVGHARRRMMSGGLFTVLSLTLSIHLAMPAAATFFAMAVGVGIGFFQCLAVVPFALLASMMPLSINGWGVREWAMIAGLGMFGVTAEQALLISVLIGLAAMAASLPGVPFLILTKQRRNDNPTSG